jgi:hypothetical protein
MTCVVKASQVIFVCVLRLGEDRIRNLIFPTRFVSCLAFRIERKVPQIPADQLPLIGRAFSRLYEATFILFEFRGRMTMWQISLLEFSVAIFVF